MPRKSHSASAGRICRNLPEMTMRLTLHTDFALRVLIQVAINDDRLTTISDIAAGFGISKNHLMKVVNDLGRRGYLETVRGRKGGIRLTREPSEINIGEIIRETENGVSVLGCLERNGYCRIEQVCVLRRALREATAAFLAALGRYTLADLIKPRRALSALLVKRPDDHDRISDRV
jgi:Rrf2 family transcriptional regulator, nitric oxide-sensitive transcriptional repressor